MLEFRYPDFKVLIAEAEMRNDDDDGDDDDNHCCDGDDNSQRSSSRPLSWYPGGKVKT